jgi:hypothetical protein
VKLRDLFETLPINARITVRVPCDDCPVNTGTVSQFMAAGEFLQTVVVSMTPGTILTIDCRQPDKRHMRHIQILTANRQAPAKVINIHRGIMRHAPAGMFRVGDGLAERLAIKQSMENREHAEELSRHYRDCYLENDIYRQILRLGGIRPPRTAYRGEYCESVPIGLRNRSGMLIDEMAYELGMDVNEMLGQIRNRRKIA